MKGVEQALQDLSEIKNPSALVSLNFCEKQKTHLSGIEKFKNLVNFT